MLILDVAIITEFGGRKNDGLLIWPYLHHNEWVVRRLFDGLISLGSDGLSD